MKVTKFEDLECWKEARTLANEVFALTNQTTLYVALDNNLMNKSQFEEAYQQAKPAQQAQRPLQELARW